jgi:ankyrin repeat protein
MSVNFTNTYDATPLRISAQSGHIEATKALIKVDTTLNNTN